MRTGKYQSCYDSEKECCQSEAYQLHSGYHHPIWRWNRHPNISTLPWSLRGSLPSWTNNTDLENTECMKLKVWNIGILEDKTEFTLTFGEKMITILCVRCLHAEILNNRICLLGGDASQVDGIWCVAVILSVLCSAAYNDKENVTGVPLNGGTRIVTMTHTSDSEA